MLARGLMAVGGAYLTYLAFAARTPTVAAVCGLGGGALLGIIPFDWVCTTWQATWERTRK